jgi:hypothetical protein
MLSSDASGFLIGETLTDIRRNTTILDQIKLDIAAIRRAVVGGRSRLSNVNTPISVHSTRQSHTDRPRNAQGQYTSTAVTPRERTVTTAERTITPREIAVTPVSIPETITQASVLRAQPREVAIPGTRVAALPSRGGNGRFTANNNRDERTGRFTANGGGDQNNEEGNQRERSMLNNVADRIADAVTASSTGLEEIDPSIMAAREVVSPIARTYQAISGGQRGDSRWLKKIFSILTLSRRDSSLFNRTATRTLGNIEDNTEDSGDGGDSSFLGGLTGGITPWILGVVASIGSALLAGITAVLGVIFSPIGLAFAAVGVAAWALFTEDGRKFLSAAGEKIAAAWTVASDYVKTTFSGIGAAIGGIWTEAVSGLAPVFESISKRWSTFVGTISKGWDKIAGIFDALYSSLKELPIIGPAIKLAEKTIKTTVEITKNTAAAVKSGYEGDTKDSAKKGFMGRAASAIGRGARKVKDVATMDVVTPTIDATKTVGKKISERWNDAKNYLAPAADKTGVDRGLLAKIANYESGFNSEATPTRKDGSKISSAHGYGQFLDSTWTEMVNKHGAKYGVKNAGILSKNDAEKLRSNKDLQASMLAEYTKENVEKGRELGGSNDDANVYALHNLGSTGGANFLKALKENPNAPVNSVKGMSDKVISGNKSLYGNGKGTIQEAYEKMGKAMDRGEVFAQDIRKSIEPIQSASIQSVSAPSPVSPILPKAQPIADIPQITTPVGGDTLRQKISVTVAQNDVGQDISTRSIALLATGGLSG